MEFPTVTNLYSRSTLVPSLDPKEENKHLHYSLYRFWKSVVQLPIMTGEDAVECTAVTPKGKLPALPGREKSLSFAVTTSKCHSSNQKENHKTRHLFWASWTVHITVLKMEVIYYDTSPNKAAPKWLFLRLFCDHTPGRCDRSAGIGFLFLCRFQNLKR